MFSKASPWHIVSSRIIAAYMAAPAGYKTPALGRIPRFDRQAHAWPQPWPARNGSRRGSAVVVFLIVFLAADLLVGHLCKLDQEVDHLFLKQRRAHARQRLWVLAIIVPHLLLATGNLAGTR